MKKIYNFIMTKPVITLLIVIVVIFLPSAISADPHGISKLIVRSIAIDKIGEEYEFSTLAYVPKATTNPSDNLQTFSAKGDTVYDAVSNLSKLVGKNIEISHSLLILVNNELCEDSLTSPLDYLVREYSLGNNTLVFSTGEISAKEVLEVGKNIAKDKGITIQDISQFNNDSVFNPCYCLERIFSETLSPNKVVPLNILTLEEDEGIESEEEQFTEGGDSEEESSEESSSSSSSESNKKLVNTGNVVIIKEEKKVFELTYDEMFDFNWGKQRDNFGLLKLRDYSDNIFTNADVSLFIFKSNAKIKAKFQNGTPICEISINPELMLYEVNQENQTEDTYSQTFHLETSQIIESINEKIGMDFSKVLRKTLEYNVDLLDVYDIFYSNNNKDFKEYLATLEDVDDYLSKMQFSINVDAEIVE
ncbi:MAG: Ger(x)C family spore germination C-terminal domain-containing protein [Clostridia bacterium]|nr:Ger(x)C family spore germination C-terminal domain-containing protein [Clostridia bacterium]